MKYSKGISWINDCRIPFVDGDKTINHNTVPGSFVGSVGYSEKIYHENTQGRFPSNLLVSDDMLNDGIVYKSSGHIRKNTKKQTIYGGGKGFPPIQVNNVPGDKGTNSRYYDIDKWFDNIIDV